MWLCTCLAVASLLGSAQLPLRLLLLHQGKEQSLPAANKRADALHENTDLQKARKRRDCTGKKDLIHQ
jgi:hypothetical protein